MNLQSLNALAASAGSSFEEEFKALHHFSTPAFASHPSKFSKFVAYCEGLARGIKANEENEVTIERAGFYLQLLSQGQSKSTALKQAWAKFPTLR